MAEERKEKRVDYRVIAIGRWLWAERSHRLEEVMRGASTRSSRLSSFLHPSVVFFDLPESEKALEQAW